MKKILSIVLSLIMLLCFAQPAFAYNISDDIGESFVLHGSLFLTKETKAGEIRYFGERISVTRKDGTELKADDYIRTGDTLSYFGILDGYRIVVMGDADCDGHITASDARLVLRMSAGLYWNVKYSEKPETYGAFDTNYSGLVEASDARDILRVAAKIDDLSCFEEAVAAKKANAKPADYDDELVMVCMNPEYVNNDAAYTPEFYGDLVGRVEVMHKYAPDHVWLYLYLKKPSKENVDMLYEQCKKNDALIATDKNHIFYIEW